MQVHPFKPQTDEGVIFFPAQQSTFRHYTRRSSLVRWIWVSHHARRGEAWSDPKAYVVDDFGNLTHITYIQASVADIKSPT